MKANRRTLIIILFVLLLSAVSCQNKPEAPLPGSTQVGGNPAPGDPTKPAPDKTKVSSGSAEGAGDNGGQFVLDAPDQGVEALQSYRQRLTSTFNGTFLGRPYSYSETVELIVSGTDLSERMETTTNGESAFLYAVRLGDTIYSQTNPQAPCSAVPAADSPANGNPARKLPPVYGAKLMNHEPMNGAAAIYYQFDARAVPHAAGKNDQATGELWTVEPGGMLLRYDLFTQVKEGDFTGEREWHYTLEVGDFTAELPENCLPLLDLPIPPDAEAVVNQPGFTRYTISSGYEDVRQFYLSALPQAGWEPLPPTKVGPDSAAPTDVRVLAFTMANPDGSGQVAVIQLNESGGAIIAAVQVIKTKSPVQSYDPAKSTPAAEEDDEEQPSEPEEPRVQPKLPEGLPVYEGGKIAMENESMVMFTTPDDPEKVIAFYAAELEEGGWKQAQDTTVPGTWMQLWEKGKERLMIVINRQGTETTVVISPG